LSNKLKIDLHTHSAEDPHEGISHSAVQLIDMASQQGFDVLSITNHNTVTWSGDLNDYAREKGILLIPGVEAKLSGKHVLIINPALRDIPSGMSLEDLKILKSPSTLIVAPHPFFPSPYSLKADLFPFFHFFDAIEYSHFYNHIINCNKKALRVAQRTGVPLVGSSDCHSLHQLGTTYTLVEAKKDKESVIEAIRRGRTDICTSPLSLLYMIKIALEILLKRQKLNLSIFPMAYRK
jgi:hypothetical protein